MVRKSESHRAGFLGCCLKVAVVLIVTGYLVWNRTGRGLPDQTVPPAACFTKSFGEDSGKGNLLAIQPRMTPADFASEQRFQARLDSYLQTGARNEWLSLKTVVVFPEYIGTFLAVAGEKREVYKAPDITSGMSKIASANIPQFGLAYLRSHSKDRLKEALFRTKAGSMADIYNKTFSELVKRYEVTIVAGSIVLPSPYIKSGRLVPGNGPLYNATAVFNPGGQAMSPAVRKVYPTLSEIDFTARGNLGDLPVFNTRAGKLAVLVCADSWYPECYTEISDKGAEILAVPSFGLGEWDAPWGGYQARKPPADIQLKDVGSITEGQAWVKYAMPGRLPESGMKAGINVFMRGTLWDLHPGGKLLAVLDGRTLPTPHTPDGCIVNLWL